ncbi:putative chromatin remodeling & transcription regulator BTB-POZ family [Arabidopsis thaliana]
MATETNKELFVGGFAKILKEQRQVDVRLKAGDSGDEGASTSAHKLVLSARSEVFKKMLESDEIKASAQLETITLCEMKHDELEAFIEFIYSDGSMLSAKEKQHVRSLYIAGDKYEIPHLRDLCRIELISSLKSSNALDILELAQIPFDKALHDSAFIKIITNLRAISTSVEFKVFANNHPNLTVQILKALTCTTSARICSRCGRCCQC